MQVLLTDGKPARTLNLEDPAEVKALVRRREDQCRLFGLRQVILLLLIFKL